jgi:mRNA-decapping enzyme subunit 2
MRAFDRFLAYKTAIPVRGAILLNEDMDSAVLVKGWKKGANWSFPRGKINREEDDLVCAMREVYEETGYDIEAAGLVPADRNVKHIDITLRDQHMSLFVFRGVPMNTVFEPRTRKEISKIQWWSLVDLPAYRKKGAHQQTAPAMNPNKFYMVAPFLPPLRKWITEQKKKDGNRPTSNQYLSADISHDELLTEEDQGTDFNPQEPVYSTSHQNIDALDESNAALRNLLNIPPLAQELEHHSIATSQPAVTEDRGGALFAFLQAKPPTSVHNGPPAMPMPHTPLEYSFSQAPQPSTPRHQQPLPPHFPSLPPPPTFPIQQGQTFSYQEANQQSQHPQLRSQGHPSSYQSQHLIHPQPLPPQVQRAVFTGGPVHSPMVPQPIQGVYQPNLNLTASQNISAPQFPNIHAPMVPPVQTQAPPKLTSHSLALLNAFKGRDANDDGSGQSNLPLKMYTEKILKPLQPPQELPAEISRRAAAASISKPSSSGIPTPNIKSSALAPRLTSEAHRSSLLDMFKSPTLQAAALAKPTSATTLPTSTTPSAVELSAVVEPLSSIPAQENQPPKKQAIESGAIPEMNSETILPFRAMTILARPAQKGDSESSRTNTSAQMAIPNGKKPTKNKIHPTKPAIEKPFQPQILKRPQPSTSKPLETPSTTPSPFSAPPNHNISRSIQNQPSEVKSATPLSALTPLDHPKNGDLSSRQDSLLALFGGSAPSPDAAPIPVISKTQPKDHKQNLLSLFGKASPAAKPAAQPDTEDILSALFSFDPTVKARSRVGSLTSQGGTPSRRPSQAPISPADKGFLLNYLDSVAKGTQR